MIDLLIVDDEKQIRDGIKRAIDWERHGIRICGAVGSAAEALNLIDKHMPGIVITDIRMPDMDGLELLEIISKQYPNIKVILISGYKDFHYAQTAITLNAFCYLLKPIDSKKLLGEVIEAKNIIKDQLRRVKQNEDIQKRLEENLSIVRETLLTRLVKGEISSRKEIDKAVDLLPLEVKGVQYCVVILQLDLPQRWTSEDWNDEGWYKAAVMNISESILNKTYVSYSFSFDNNIGLLIQGQEIKADILTECFGSVKEKVNSSLGLSLTVGIGNAYPSLAEIPISCQEALSALDHMVIMGKNIVIHADILNDHVRNKVAIVSFENIIKNSENDLIYALKAGDSKAVYQIIDDIISVMKQVIKTDIREKEHLGFLLVFFLTKILSSLNIRDHGILEEPHDLYNKFKNNQTIDEIQNFLCRYMDDVMKELRDRIKGQNGFLVKQAIRYINTNVYNGISLAKVADHLGIHPNYLSKIFSQETGESFIDYSIKIRLQEAKHLLRNTNYKVYQIAGQLHYKDVGHFTRVFKKTFGVSPTEYRQLF